MDKIVVTAERLFADHGIEGVSLRRIAREAGQKNVVAASYHFGTKEDLVKAIYERRVEEDDRRRLYYLSLLTEHGLDRDLRAIVAATIRPLAEELVAGEEGWHYLRFQAQLRIYSNLLYREVVLEGPSGEGVRKAIDIAAPLLPVLPAAVLEGRIELALELVLSSLAERARRLMLTPKLQESHDTFIAILIDAVASLLSAPVYPPMSMEIFDPPSSSKKSDGA